MAHNAFSDASLRRIERLTVILGAMGAVWAGTRWGWKGGVGLAIGAVLSWINFRWIQGTVRRAGRAIVAGAAEATAGGTSVPVATPRGSFLKFLARFVLLVGVIYVILTRTGLPAIPVLTGLFAAAAGVIVGLVYELLWSGLRPDTGKD
jgi:ATP synthase I chain